MPAPDVAPEIAATARRRLDLETVRRLIGHDLLAVRADGADGADVAVTVQRQSIRALAAGLRDECGYQLLLSLTAVDKLPAVPRFEVVYHFAALAEEIVAGRPSGADGPGLRRLRVNVPVPEDDPLVNSLVAVYAGANWPEREVYDMFGIEFAGHPDLRRILMPVTYPGHPLRKDHPLVYEEVAFSHNRERIDGAKPRADR